MIYQIWMWWRQPFPADANSFGQFSV
jgi:hypothetical protein